MMSNENEMIKLAIAYARDNRVRVSNLFNSAKQRSAPEIEPSGSDRLHPELWKDIHWAWYFGRDWA